MSLNSMRNNFGHASKWILGVVTIAMLVTAYTGIGSVLTGRHPETSTQTQQNNPDAPIATVNGDPITRFEYENAYALQKRQADMEAQYGGQPSGPLNVGQIRTQAFNQVVSQTLATQIAKQAGITVTQADIDSARSGQLGQVKQMLNLPATATTDQVNSALASTGQSVSSLFPDAILRKQVATQKYSQYIQHTMIATDSDVQRNFRQVHTRHILIANKKISDAEAKAQAQSLIDKIKGGADFVALCKKYSDDPGTKDKGGDDGWISASTGYVPEFLNAALSLQANQVTPEPIASPQYGYFIIQALGVKEQLPKDFASNKTKYIQQVSQTIQSKAEDAALTAAQQSAKITVNDPLLSAYRAFTTPPAPGVDPMTSAVSNFQKALTTADFSTKGEIHAQLAQIYGMQNKPQLQIQELTQALAATEDPQLRMMLGQAYAKSGDTKDALAQYQLASTGAYNDPNTHMQLQQVYKTMGQPALMAKEQDWMKQYTQRQKQASANVPSAPGGSPITVVPQAPTKK